MFIPYEVNSKPKVEVENGRPTLIVRDPILGRDIVVKPDVLALSTGIIPNEGPSLGRLFGVETNQDGFFLEAELGWTAVVERSKPDVSRIIPGNWGKAESGWLARPLGGRIARFGSGGRIHQFLWRRARAVSNATRNLAARNNQKLFRVESSNSSWFRA
jgi:hypothetical protein